MAVTERLQSRPLSVEPGRAEHVLEFNILGPTTEDAALAELSAATPTVRHGLYRRSLAVEPVTAGVWIGTATYGELPPTEVGQSSWHFDATAKTLHITHSLGTIARYPPDAPVYETAIGVTDDGVEGADIYVPSFEFSETHQRSDASMTTAYRNTIFHLTGRVNDAPFKGFARGEVLFLGATGSKRGTERWEVTYRFACSPNQTNVPVGPFTVAEKEGWHLIWVRYGRMVDGDVVVQRPMAVYVERVYEYGDFSQLGIGT